MSNPYNAEGIPDAENPGIVIAGDWLDDDGQVMDDLLRNQTEPPPTSELPTGLANLPEVTPPRIKRLINKNYAFPIVGTGPVMALPADPKRTLLTFRGLTSGGLSFAISGERNDLIGEATQAYICNAVDAVQLVGYTGALWVSIYDEATRSVVSAAAGNFAFTVSAVTE